MSIMMMTWTKTADHQHVTNLNIGGQHTGPAIESIYLNTLSAYQTWSLYIIGRDNLFLFYYSYTMNHEKVKLIAHNLKLLAISLEDAIKEDPEAYKTMPEKPTKLGYRYSDDDDGYAD